MNEPLNHTVKDINGNQVNLRDYLGKTTLLVNVASKCGLTPQYKGLQELYDKYKDKGFVILGFPANDFMGQNRDRIQLYSNQVFVTDSVENIVPDFLMLMKGVIDSPDIPLNVSRSYLQSDASVKKISSHISKKVAEKLEELFKADRTDFEKKWDDVKVFIQYGMLSDEKFYERAKSFCLLKTTGDKCYTLDEFAGYAV